MSRCYFPSLFLLRCRKKKRENFIFCRCCVFFPFFCLILYFPFFLPPEPERGCAALESILFDLHVTRLCRSEDNFCVATMGHMHQAAAATRAKRFRKKVKDVHKMNTKKRGWERRKMFRTSMGNRNSSVQRFRLSLNNMQILDTANWYNVALHSEISLCRYFK